VRCRIVNAAHKRGDRTRVDCLALSRAIQITQPAFRKRKVSTSPALGITGQQRRQLLYSHACTVGQVARLARSHDSGSEDDAEQCDDETGGETWHAKRGQQPSPTGCRSLLVAGDFSVENLPPYALLCGAAHRVSAQDAHLAGRVQQGRQFCPVFRIVGQAGCNGIACGDAVKTATQDPAD
jgi:hypothetical protein